MAETIASIEGLFAALERIGATLAGGDADSASLQVTQYDHDVRAFMDSAAGRATPAHHLARLLEAQQALLASTQALQAEDARQQGNARRTERAARAYLAQGG